MRMSDSNELFDNHEYSRLSYAQKSSNDWRWLRDSIKNTEGFFGSSYEQSQAWYKKCYVNYQLAQGRGANHPALKSILHTQDVSKDSDIIKHRDLLRKILTRQFGEQKKRKLKMIALDTSKYNVNIRKKKKLELYQDLLKQNVLDPIEQQSSQEVFLKHGIKNPHDLDAEQQDQIQSEIQQKIKFKTPNDIENFMRKDYKSPSESQLQGLIDWVIKEYNLKFMLDESFKDLCITGIAANMQGIVNNRPHIEIVNPMGFRFFNPSSSPFIEDGEWWSYEKQIAYSQFINEYVTDESLFKKLKHNIAAGSGISNSETNRMARGELQDSIMLAAANSVNGPADHIDLQGNVVYGANSGSNTSNTGNFQSEILRRFGSHLDFNYSTVRVAKTVFSSFDKLYHVKRKNPQTGKLKDYWFGENYNPAAHKDVDFKVTTRWVRALYQGTSLGYDGEFFLDKGRVPFQNRSINDPFKLYPPFVGIEYSKMHGNVERIAPLDLGKPSNDEYSRLKNKIEELEEANIGNVLLMDKGGIPDNTNVEQFSADMKKHKIAMIDSTNPDFNPQSYNLFKQVDLGTNREIAENQARLKAIELECAEQMSYSPSQLGLAPASMTATNNQQNIIQGSYATEDLYSLQKMYERNTVNSFANLSRNALRDNEHLRTYMLNDLSIAELELSHETLHLSDLAIVATNDTEEIRGLESLKNLLQPLIQNQLVDMSDVIKIQFSDSPADLINLAEQSYEKAMQRNQDQMKAAREDQEAARKYQLQRDEIEDKFRTLELELKELGYRLDSDKFRSAADADNNKIPDAIETARIKAIADLEKTRELITSAEKISGIKNATDNVKIQEETKRAKFTANNKTSS